MKALRYYGPEDIRYEAMDDPVLRDDRDAIVKVERCSICGSDLHIYHGHGRTNDVGYCVGHEAVGEVVETGRAVTRLKVGDKVMISAAVGCGSCAPCLSGNVVLCANFSSTCYGLGAALQGSQAEAVRVPAADFNAARIPDGISADQALLLTDNLPTAWYGARNADVSPGKTVAVVGLGPIGLMTVECALVMGASRVFAIDLVPARRALAAQLGAVACSPDDVVSMVRDATRGHMVDSVIEAVGADVTINLALKLAGRRGSISVVGANQNGKFEFPMGLAFWKGLTFRIGTCSVPEEWPQLIPLLQQGRLHPERYMTHVFSLAEGARAYSVFDRREDGALKIVLTP